MIYEEEIFPEEFQQKLDAFEIIQKAFDSELIGSETFFRASEELEKAKKDLGKLVKIRKIVVRDGKPFLATFHVRPDGEHVEDKSKPAKEVEAKMPMVVIGEKLSVTTTKGEVIEGTLTIINTFKKGEEIRNDFVIETAPGVFKKIILSRIKETRTLSRSVDEKPSVLESSDFKYDHASSTKVADLGGSGKNFLFKDKDGDLFTVKLPRDRDTGLAQLEEETTADNIYRALGYEAPNSKIETSGATKIKVAKYIEGVKEYGSLSTEAKKKAKEEIQKGFVLDCLLSNWDVIGANYDNILCTSDGSKVMRVDNGGSLRYRARGAAKGALFSDSVIEIDSLRDSSINPYSANIFSGISDEEIASQVRKIQKDWSKIESSVKDKTLLAKLTARRIDLEDRFLDEKKLKAKEEALKAEAEKAKAEADRLAKEEKEKKALGEYPSLTTKKYFESKEWENLELEGNKGLKEHIKKQIISIEKKYEAQIKRAATDQGMSLEEYKEKLQAKTVELVKNSDCFIAVHSLSDSRDEESTMEKIFSSGGKFKTQFETKTSRGSLSYDSRSRTEKGYFDFPTERTVVNDANRPVYGYFSTHESGVINTAGKIPPPNHVSQYGDVSFKLKKSVALKKATVTFQDSLGSETEIAATPFAYPHFTSTLNTSYSKSNPIESFDEAIKKKVCPRSYSYVEAQYHGQLHLDDIESLHINPNSLSAYSEMEKMKKLTRVINSVKDYAVKAGKKDLKIELFA